MRFQIKAASRSRGILPVVFLLFLQSATAQQYLSRQIQLEVRHQRLAAVLDSIGRKAGFVFSYNSARFPGDSVVSFKGAMQVETILDQLLAEKYDYKEMKGYVVLRYAPNTFRIYTQPPILTRRGALLSGNIVDETTGKSLENVSIYEKTSLVAVLTDKKGYFQIPLLSDSGAVTLTVSKLDYHDMVMTLLPTVRVQTRSRFDSLAYRKTGASSDVNRSFFGKMFISTRQRIQSLNISDFFARRSYQFSVIPKWNTRGDMSGQVISKFSLNLLAGYNAGIHGFELGTIANLNRTEVNGVQLAGAMNIVGGNSAGFQVAGLSNQVYQQGQGLQMAGLRNKVNGSYAGIQVAGLENKVGGKLQGLQMVGLRNTVKDSFSGMQVAGLENKTDGEQRGLQLAGLLNSAGQMQGMQIGGVNKASRSTGVQFGLVNLLDTASGYGIGLINVARHGGFYQLSVFASESAVANIAFKSGREAFYTKLLFGIGHADVDYFYYGFGVGHIFPSQHRMKISLDGAVENYVRNNNDKANILYTSSLEFHFPLARRLALFIGPSVNLFRQGKDADKPIDLPMKHYPTINRGHDLSGWFGVNAGFDIL